MATSHPAMKGCLVLVTHEEHMKNLSIDQFHNTKNWRIMFKLLIAVKHKKYEGCGSNSAKPELQSMFHQVINFFALGRFI